MRSFSPGSLSLASFALAFTLSAAARAELTVNVDSDDDDGLCDAAHCSLREALNQAAVGERIVLTTNVVLQRSLAIATDGVRLSGNDHSIDAGRVVDGRPGLHVRANAVTLEQLSVNKAGRDCIVVERNPGALRDLSVAGCGGRGIVAPCADLSANWTVSNTTSVGIELIVGAADCSVSNLAVTNSLSEGIVVNGDAPATAVALNNVSATASASSGIILSTTASGFLSGSANNNVGDGVVLKGKGSSMDLGALTARGNRGSGLIMGADTRARLAGEVLLQSNDRAGAAVFEQATLVFGSQFIVGGGNKGLYLDLGNDGVTLNDIGDVDSGGNGLLNAPIDLQLEIFADGTGRLNGVTNDGATLMLLAPSPIDRDEPATALRRFVEGSSADLDTGRRDVSNADGDERDAAAFTFALDADTVAASRGRLLVLAVVGGVPSEVRGVGTDLCEGPGAIDVDACDVDADGINNGDERAAGSDPEKPDTDDDGEPDGVEFAVDSDGDGRSDAIESTLIDSEGDGVVDEDDPANGDPCVPAEDNDACARARDPDQDGLDSDVEVAAGLDPDNADTDGDGDLDGDEFIDDDSDGIVDAAERDDVDQDGDGVFDEGDNDNLDPCAPALNNVACDADLDGVPTLVEVANGSDPDVVDSDGDGAVDGIEYSCNRFGECFAFDSDGDGRIDAVERGDVDEDGDGSSAEVDVDESDPCEPLRVNAACDGDDDGATLVEELANGTDPTNPDSDNDGIEDGDEPAGDSDRDGVADALDRENRNPCAPSIAVPVCDLDGDGLDLTGETAAGTNPFSADTDGDFLSDAAELGADSDGDGIDDALESVRVDVDGDGVVDQADSDNADPCVPSRAAGTCDQDGDGIDNATEAAFGTDATGVDFDGDGIVDGAEGGFDTDGDGVLNPVDAENLDACVPDARHPLCDLDRDGATLAEEEAAGSDPTVADTDGDGVPDGVEVGSDRDADGLDDAVEANDADVDGDAISDEVDPVVLPPACEGQNVLLETVVIQTQEEHDAFVALGITCVVGNLIIGGTVQTVSLDGLLVVTGRVVVRQSEATSVALNDLQRVGSFEVEENDNLETLTVPALAFIDGDLSITDNPVLRTLDITALRRVLGTVTITRNSALVDLLVPNLEEVGGDVVITDNDALESVVAPALTGVGGDLVIADNDELESVDVSDLQNVGGDLVLSDNDSLESVDLSSVTGIGGDLVVSDNDSLASVDLSGLAGVGGDLVIADNPVLDDVDLTVLEDVGGTTSIDTTAVRLPQGLTCNADGCTVVCGDGARHASEACDDGNVDDGDGCSAACTDEPAAPAVPDEEGGCAQGGAPAAAVLLLALLRRRRAA